MAKKDYMSYLDLVAKTGNPDDIEYIDLLNTTEWLKRRQEIIYRDNYCCANCGLSSTREFDKFLISFQLKSKIEMTNIIYEERPIEELKQDLDIKNIYVIKAPNAPIACCGISLKGDIFLLQAEQFRDKDRVNVVVNTGETADGQRFQIIGKKDNRYNSLEFYLAQKTKDMIYMHVHHKMYIRENLPWEYEDEALVTLCNLCHWKLHEEEKIKIYTKVDGVLRELNYRLCIRCNGSGHLPQYNHVQHGICFRCRGKRFEELIL